MVEMASLEEIALKILDGGACEARDVDGGADPFVYTTGNRGPGYLMIKGLVGQPKIFKFLVANLARRVVDETKFGFIEGNATGGMIPAWQLRNDVSELLGKEIPFCYLRGSRKLAGHGELITGDRNNPLIQKGMKALVVEELVNYAKTTTNAAEEFRGAGYPVSHAACILSYDHDEANVLLDEHNVTLISLITLPQLLDIAEANGIIPEAAVKSYRDFLVNPVRWQLERGLVIPEGSVKKAKEQRYVMRELEPDEAIKLGAPEEKVNMEGLVYWARVD